jgi:hypothetical protein
MPPKVEKKEDVVESLGPKKNDGEQVVVMSVLIECVFIWILFN